MERRSGCLIRRITPVLPGKPGQTGTMSQAKRMAGAS